MVPQSTDFQHSSIWEDEVVLKGLIFNNFHFLRVWCLVSFHFGRIWWT